MSETPTNKAALRARLALAWAETGRLVRRLAFCSVGGHYRVERATPERGICSAGRCLDCGATWPAVEWPRMPIARDHDLPAPGLHPADRGSK